ncbi:conjugal transfer protein [Saccharolobus caldissimus]|uniref:Uncharacterized protein n=1 Tax=Saccharolobus caldissimus TaxID=1702097 RepID=A0AAQ4CNS8_9CREN|nr:conjugal transfer protein [Saccharolobus caldissimus]BDB97459.1 hypothetical protein SACC_04760 [Saccharolobus caldissimus]
MVERFLIQSILDFAFLFFIYELRNYRLLKRAKYLCKIGTVKVYQIESEDPNAITIKSLIFGKSIIFVGRITKEIYAHEEGHLHQPNFMFYFLIAAALMIAYNVLTVPLLLIVYKIMFWHYERDADLYAYRLYNVKYESDVFRPKSQIERLKAWIFDTHPPDYVRKIEEYYDKKTNILKLFIHDLIS